MNERNLSRKLSSSVVDALKAHGHILVVKGGATALARELDDLMAPEIVTIEPRLKPYSPLVEEPTSTFGDENVDQTVEDMVQKLTHALMRSDHVEDVFAEDAVIRRDIFRVVRDGLREPVPDGGDDSDHASVTVKLDALGYVAATAGRRADTSTLRRALDRAASVAGARFAGFNPELREATFRLEGGGADERLELEEAVADELTDLVEQGVVELPTIERRIDLGRPLTAAEVRALRGRIAAAAEATLLRSGCAAEWEMADARTLRVVFTPLSERDAEGVDAPTSAFAREIAALLGGRVEPAPKSTGKAPAAEPSSRPLAAGPEPSTKTPSKRGAPPASAKPSPAEPAKASEGARSAAARATAEAAPAAPKRKTKSAAEQAPAAPETEEPVVRLRDDARKATDTAPASPAAKRATKKAATKAPASSRKGTGKTASRTRAPAAAKAAKAPAKKA